jgi:two-component system sensor histidine kinase VicK
MDQKSRLFTNDEIVGILALSKDATAIYTNEDLIIQFANDAMIAFWGRNRSVIGKPFADAVPELSGQPFFDLLREVWRTGITYEAKDTAAQLMVNGKLQWFYYDFKYSAIKDEYGRVTCILHTATDVTERHVNRQVLKAGNLREQDLTEELTVINEELNAASEEVASTNKDLLRSHQLLMTLNDQLEERVATRTNDFLKAQAEAERQRDRITRFFMQAPAGICVLDGPRFVFELVNPIYQQLFPSRQLLGKPILDAIPEVEDQPAWNALNDVYRTGIAYEGKEVSVFLAKTVNGSLEEAFFNFTYQARRDEKGDIDGVIAFVIEVTDMVLARRKISESERGLRSLVMSSHYGLMILRGRDWKIEIVNQQIASLWQKELPDITGKKLLDVLPEIEDQPFPALLANVYDTGLSYGQEEEVLYLDSPEGPVKKFVSFYYDPMLDSDGKVTGVIVACEDVTEKVKATQLLEESYAEQQSINEELSAANEELAAVNEELLTAEQRIEEGEVALRLAIDAANFGTWFIHSVTREFITDARLKELFGYRPDEDLTIEGALAQITDEYRGFVATALENAIYNGGDYDVTYPVIGLHDNQLRWLRAIGNLKADPSGEFSAFTGVVLDITDQILASKRLEEAQESLRIATESGELATWYLSEKLDKIVASERFYEMFGFEPNKEVPYAAAIDRIMPDYRQMVHEAVLDSLKTGAHFNVEYPIVIHNDGRQRWVRSVGKYVDDEKNGNYITGVMADITEQKTDEIRKNDFIGMVSHELKTPLTSLSAIIQLAALKLKSTEDAFLAGAMDTATNQVKKMGNMINGFLNISRLESGKILIVKEDFDFDDLLTEMIAEAQLTIPTHTIDFSPCGPLIINADRDKIGSVISNLISNAVKYSPKGSIVKIKCKSTAEEVLVSIKDEGMGIKQQDINKIFDRYYRVQTEHTQHISGFGIGLYLSSEIVGRHEGKIWVESEVEKGSVFYFSLPRNSSPVNANEHRGGIVNM